MADAGMVAGMDGGGAKVYELTTILHDQCIYIHIYTYRLILFISHLFK